MLSQYGSDLSVEELADLTKNNKYGHRQVTLRNVSTHTLSIVCPLTMCVCVVLLGCIRRRATALVLPLHWPCW